MTAGQRFARLAATVAVRWPRAWALLRAPLRRQFDRLAPTWESRVGPQHFAALGSALDELAEPPRRILDVGTGSGAAARYVAGRWPDAEVTAVDLSPAMVAEAARRGGLRERYLVADAARLPFPDGAFDLVVQVNAIPFAAELARVVAPGGSVAVSYTRGASTPIWVPLERSEAELARFGVANARRTAAGEAVALVATKS